MCSGLLLAETVVQCAEDRASARKEPLQAPAQEHSLQQPFEMYFERGTLRDMVIGS